MELVVSPKHHICNISTALDVTGCEHLVVIAKATWKIPAPNQRPKPIQPSPLCTSDEYYGAPGESAMRYGDDFARFKPRCDVIFDSVAYAPDNRPARFVDVAVQVGTMKKHIQVIGPRKWERGLIGVVPGSPEPFTHMPLHYGFAFGGMRVYRHKGETLYDVREDNPVGIGWAGAHTWHKMIGESVPNLEHPKHPVRSPEGKNTPIALSAIAPAWPSRLQFGGTFDEAWRHDVAPFMPDDFDERYHQCAPVDQQIDYPQGGEEVILKNIVESYSLLKFRLPPLANMKVRILRKDYSVEELDAPADTLFFETEKQRFSVIWRASTPIHKRLQEFDLIAVGAVNPQWWQARRLGIDGEGCAGCSRTSIA